jgi:multiple sugar transport system substrate-binding protein
MSFVGLQTRTGRAALAAVFLCLLALSHAGCSPFARIPTPEAVTIAFSCAERDQEYYERLVYKFGEQYPHITVELRPRGRQGQGPTEAGEVDALIAPEGTLRELHAQGDLLDVQPFIETDLGLDLDDIHPGAMALFSYRGETWALPAGLDVDVMYYNQDLFDQYGVPYPWIGWTWDDFLYAALALRDPDAAVYGYVTTGTTVNPTYWDALDFIAGYGGRIFDHPVEPSRTTFDDPLVVDALDWYARLYHEHDVAPTPKEAQTTLRSGSPIQYAFYEGIFRGRVGMWIMPFSEQGGAYWPNQWEMRWGMALMPRGAQEVTFPDGEGYAISAHTAHPQACWQWIAYLSKEMPNRLIPARTSHLESIEYTEAVGSDAAAVARASLEVASLDRPAPWVYDEFAGVYELFSQAVDKVISEDWLPREALDWAQQEAEKGQGNETTEP